VLVANVTAVALNVPILSSAQFTSVRNSTGPPPTALSPSLSAVA
jgi:hypothetical protein